MSQRVSSEGVPSSLPVIASPLTELPSPLSAQTTKKKSGTRKSTAQRASEREFTKGDKAEALLSAIEKIVENNNLLREKCRSVEDERERREREKSYEYFYNHTKSY
jgi:hypothetical protein